MSESIKCPQCGAQVDVNEVLAAQLRAQLGEEFSRQWRSKESALESKALAKAKESVSLELREAKEVESEMRKKLEQAQQAELTARKERREIEDRFRTFELEMARRLDTERATIRETAKREVLNEHQLKEAANEKRITDLLKEIENLKLKAEQGSQQLQGEVLELDLEAILRQQFPTDGIEPVAKGIHGGDVVHIVRDCTGQDCGTILWESKNTKHWSDLWLPKLRSDQRNGKAHVAILVSEELPKSVTTFAYIDEVWVTSRCCCIGLAIALRCGILDLANARRALDGQQGKMEVLYNYLSSPAFRSRVNGIVEAFATLHADLEAEKRAVNRLWTKREQQINQAMKNTAGMYGDLQGIIGGGLPVIDQLEFPALPSPDGQFQLVGKDDS